MKSHLPILGLVVAAGAVMAAGGCASEGRGPGARPGDSRGSMGAGGTGVPAERGAEASDPGNGGQPVRGAADAPVVVINGETIGWTEVQRGLGEAAGGLVVEEMVMTSALRREFLRRGWTLSRAEITAEDEVFLENVRGAGGGDASGQVVDTVKRARGLGPARYAALLERNAMLRRLVRDDVTVTGTEVDQAAAVRYGEKVRVRLIVVQTERAASEIHDRLTQPGGDVSERFAQEAVRSSIDPTGPRGGLNEAVSPMDPSLPVGLRRAIEQTPVGEVSAVIGLDRTFALVLPEGRTAGRAVEPAERAALEREVRARKERLAMEEVARRMVEESSVTVFDPSLRYGWENRRRRP